MCITHAFLCAGAQPSVRSQTWRKEPASAGSRRFFPAGETDQGCFLQLDQPSGPAGPRPPAVTCYCSFIHLWGALLQWGGQISYTRPLPGLHEMTFLVHFGSEREEIWDEGRTALALSDENTWSRGFPRVEVNVLGGQRRHGRERSRGGCLQSSLVQQ